MQCHVQGCQPTYACDESPNDEEPDARNGGDGNKSKWYCLQVPLTKTVHAHKEEKSDMQSYEEDDSFTWCWES